MTDRKQHNNGFRTTANKLTRFTADDCKDGGLPTNSKQPHPNRCETCESFHEEKQVPRYRCSWNCCYVHPKDECPCRPSHWKEADHTTKPPVKSPNSTELLLMAHTDWKKRIERKHTHDEIPWVDGWIHGYLTPKPDFLRIAPCLTCTSGQTAREKVLGELSEFEHT